MKVLFLDIDGVLNCQREYDWDWNAIAQFTPRCVHTFNSIIYHAKAKIVLSSSWRNFIHNNYMTLRGFEKLLWSHGVRGDLIGLTPERIGIDDTRADEIGDWLQKNFKDVERYVVIDDDPDAFGGGRHPFVQTDFRYGIRTEDAKKAVELLGGCE